MMYCTTTNLKNNLARGNVKFTTGKLDVMNNHLLNCDYVPPQVQDCASKHRKSDSNETSDDDAGSTVTSKRSHSLIESGEPSQDRTGARLTKKQKSFTVIATKHAPFNTKKQTLFEDQLLRAPAQVIDGFKIGIKKRNRQIETLENEKAEQANEIEQLKAQLNLLARAQIDREKLEQLLKEWISAGFSFNSIEDPEVRKLFSDLIPGATIPHRDQLSGTILKRAVAQHEYHLQTEAKGQLATLQCDGWRDVSKKHLVAFMYTMAREVSDQPTHFW